MKERKRDEVNDDEGKEKTRYTTKKKMKKDLRTALFTRMMIGFSR